MTHTLTDEQLGELLELMADADSVELKVTVPESDQYSAPRRSGWTRWKHKSGRSTSSTRRT
jgi:hypothetical protein